jgi:hypothetical protein
MLTLPGSSTRRDRSNTLDAEEERLQSVLVRLLHGSVLLLTLLVLASCGGSGSASDEERAETKSTVEETSESTGETTGDTGGETTVETGDEAPASAKPYTAIVAAAESQYDEESGGEAASSDGVLVDGAQDLSDGPLKENRLVAY